MKTTIHGNHFPSIMVAMAEFIQTGYRPEDVELVFDDDEKTYTLWAIEDEPKILTTNSY